MSRNYKFRDQEKLYFVTFSVINWIDVFVRREYKDVIVESLRYCMAHKGLEIYAWCVMTSHVHLIIGTTGEKLEDILRDLKRHTAKALLKEIEMHPQESRKAWMLWMMRRAGERNPNNQTYQFWQQHNHPIELASNEMMQQKLDYLHHNPVEAGFVGNPEDYLYSSAGDYAGTPGLLAVCFVE